MSLESEVKLLRNIPLFENIDPSKLKLLAFTSDWVTYESGQILCKQGEIGDAAFVVIEGVVEILVDSPDGPVLVSTRDKNEIVGEIAIFCDVPRTATVQARGEVATLRIAKETFLQLVTSYPQVAVEIIRILALRLTATTDELTRAKSQHG
jgi:CRP-like cAMP-binding protein